MSWLEKVETEMIITTGDGQPYAPDYMNAVKSVEYNVAEFNFPGIAGTFVDRRLPKGRKFNLELYFQGDDHLDVAEAFEASANDSRAWEIEHPFYGLVIVQPTSLQFDNSKQNLSKITGTVIETILEDAPRS